MTNTTQIPRRLTVAAAIEISAAALNEPSFLACTRALKTVGLRIRANGMEVELEHSQRPDAPRIRGLECWLKFAFKRWESWNVALDDWYNFNGALFSRLLWLRFTGYAHDVPVHMPQVLNAIRGLDRTTIKIAMILVFRQNAAVDNVSRWEEFVGECSYFRGKLKELDNTLFSAQTAVASEGASAVSPGGQVKTGLVPASAPASSIQSK